MSDEERIEQLELEVKVLRDNNKGLKDKIKAKIKWYEDFRGSILYEKYNYEEFVKDLQSLLEKE